MSAADRRASMDVETILILDFGSQYAQLIARRVREAGAFSVLLSPETSIEELAAYEPRGIILSGGPSSIHESGSPRCDERLFELGVPVLGICYGMQLGCHLLGCSIAAAESREYGRSRLQVQDTSTLLATIPEDTAVWMSHGDQVMGLADEFDILASTETCPFAAVRHREKPFFGLQFHPEVTHTPRGVDMLRNFLYEICGCTG